MIFLIQYPSIFYLFSIPNKTLKLELKPKLQRVHSIYSNRKRGQDKSGPATCGEPHAHLLLIWTPPHALTDSNTKHEKQDSGHQRMNHSLSFFSKLMPQFITETKRFQMLIFSLPFHAHVLLLATCCQCLPSSFLNVATLPTVANTHSA